MDGRPHGIQMTPTGGGPKYLRTLCWQGTHQCSAFFCSLRNLADCARREMLQTDFRREMGRLGSFAGVRGRDVRNLVVGYFSTISENKFVFVR